MPLFTQLENPFGIELVTIKGTISADGKILSGCGFNVEYLGTGAYVVEFDEPFCGQKPQIEITVAGLSQGAYAKTIEAALTAFKYFTIKVEPDKMYQKDYKVNFSAMGLVDTSKSKSVSSLSLDSDCDTNATPDIRTLEGSIDADGNVISGEGFRVEHISTGAYLVKFDTPFKTISPSPATLEIINPFIEPYGYKVDIIGQIYTSQFKYFTYVIDDTTLTMKDLPLSKFMVWGT